MPPRPLNRLAQLRAPQPDRDRQFGINPQATAQNYVRNTGTQQGAASQIAWPTPTLGRGTSVPLLVGPGERPRSGQPQAPPPPSEPVYQHYGMASQPTPGYVLGPAPQRPPGPSPQAQPPAPAPQPLPEPVQYINSSNSQQYATALAQQYGNDPYVILNALTGGRVLPPGQQGGTILTHDAQGNPVYMNPWDWDAVPTEQKSAVMAYLSGAALQGNAEYNNPAFGQGVAPVGTNPYATQAAVHGTGNGQVSAPPAAVFGPPGSPYAQAAPSAAPPVAPVAMSAMQAPPPLAAAPGTVNAQTFTNQGGPSAQTSPLQTTQRQVSPMALAPQYRAAGGGGQGAVHTPSVGGVASTQPRPGPPAGGIADRPGPAGPGAPPPPGPPAGGVADRPGAPAAPPGSSQPPANPQPDTTDNNGLPISSELLAAQQAAADQLAAELSGLQYEESQIGPMVNLMLSRLQEDENEDMRQIDEQMNERGLFNSGIRTHGRRTRGEAYGRQRTDTALQTGRLQQDIALRRQRAHANYQRMIADALMAIAQIRAQDPTTPGGTADTDEPNKPGNGGGNGNGGGGNQGGGKGGGGGKGKNKNKNKNKNGKKKPPPKKPNVPGLGRGR